jgi:carboxyl-terminal processing protease
MGEKKELMDDLFDDVPTNDNGENGNKKGVNADMPPSKPKKQRKTIRAVTAIILAAACFVLGGFAVWFSMDGEIRTLLKLKLAIQQKYYQDIDDDEFYDAVFQGINHNLLDAYSSYMTADEFRAEQGGLAGKRIGIGLVFQTKDADGREEMLVVRVCGNSPADSAGVRINDRIVGYGKTEADMVESEVFADFSKFLSTLAEGEKFIVRVNRGAETLNLTMSREAYVENYVFYRTSATAYAFTGKKADVWSNVGEPLTCLEEDTAYIRLIQFGDGTEKQFDKAMAQFKADGKKNLVLDLRDNGGGYLNTMQAIAGYFCKNSTEKKPIAVVAKYKWKKETFKANRNVYEEYFTKDSRIYVLADEGTASASECLIGAMVDYGAVNFSDICLIERNGVAKTYGKGIMQTTYYLGAKLDAVKLTTAEICWPVSGKSIHGRGVLPEDGAKTSKENGYGDEEIANAIEVLRGTVQ